MCYAAAASDGKRKNTGTHRHRIFRGVFGVSFCAFLPIHFHPGRLILGVSLLIFLVMVMKQLVVKEGGQGFFFYWYGLFISLYLCFCCVQGRKSLLRGAFLLGTFYVATFHRMVKRIEI